MWSRRSLGPWALPAACQPTFHRELQLVVVVLRERPLLVLQIRSGSPPVLSPWGDRMSRPWIGKQLGCRDGAQRVGGEGFTFVMQTAGLDAAGCAGTGVGYAGAKGCSRALFFGGLSTIAAVGRKRQPR